jgi:drug/metabolite transporter superfamily protein YnfA
MIAVLLNFIGCYNVLIWLRYSHDLVSAHTDVMSVLDQ